MPANRRRDLITLILAASIVLGFAIRMLPAIMAGSPINDGGLFYQMVRDLVAHGYRIPRFTEYNHLNIPFVYPPLGLYLIAAVQRLTGIDLHQLFRYLPPLLATFTIPAMWLLASLLLKDRLRGALAAFLYAVMPVSFNLLIMGGGITRAPGMVFLLLTLACAYLLFTTQATRYVLLAGIFAALAVLSHPEAALHSLLVAMLFWGFFGRNRKTILQAALSAALAAGLSSPWWLGNLLKHGAVPYLSALAARPRDSLAFLYFLQFNLTGEGFLTVIGVCAAVGMLASWRQRQWLLPAWLLLGFAASQRAAPYSSEIPLTLLAVIGCDFMAGATSPPLERLYKSRAHLNSLLVLIIYCFASGLTSALRIGYGQRILPAERAAFTWIAENVRADSRFVILNGGSSPANDPVSEWFPALAGATSLATVQGHEWTAAKTMTAAWMEYVSLQSCSYHGPECLEKWADQSGADFSHVYVSKYRLLANGSAISVSTPMEELLRSSPEYRIIYDSPAAVIFVVSQANANP